MEAAVLERLRARVRSRGVRSETHVKHLIDTAAVAVGKTLSEFMLDSARQHPIDVLLAQRLFILDPEKHAAFLNALDNPPPAGTKLKALMKRKPLWQK